METLGKRGHTIIRPTTDILVRNRTLLLYVLVIRARIQLLLHPRAQSACFPSCMCKLDTDERALGVNKVDDAFQGRDLGVLPYTGVFGRDLQYGRWCV